MCVAYLLALLAACASIRGSIPKVAGLAAFLLGMTLGCTEPESSDFTPGIPLGIVVHDEIDEASGIAASRRNPGLLWVHNDGSIDRLFVVSTNGMLLATFQLAAEIEDCEDMAMGPGPLAGGNYLYLGDIGDNDHERQTIRVYRAPEPAVNPGNRSGSTARLNELDRITLRYPEGRYDAETLLIDPLSGDLFIATKQSHVSRIYRAGKEELERDGVIQLAFEREIIFDSASGGDISASGDKLLLRNEDDARLWKREIGQSIEAALAVAGANVPVIGRPKEPNGEAIAFHLSGSSYYTLSEGKNQPIYFFQRNALPKE